MTRRTRMGPIETLGRGVDRMAPGGRRSASESPVRPMWHRVNASGEVPATGCSDFDLDAAHITAYSNETLTFAHTGDFSVYVTLEEMPECGTPTIYMYALGWGVLPVLGHGYGALMWGARFPPRVPPITVYAGCGDVLGLAMSSVFACPIPAPPGSPSTPPAGLMREGQ